LIELLNNYGPSPLKFLKPFFSDIEQLALNSTTGVIKKEVMNFYKEAYKWLGELIP